MSEDYSRESNPDGTVSIFKGNREVLVLVPHPQGYRACRPAAGRGVEGPFLSTVGTVQDGIDLAIGIFR